MNYAEASAMRLGLAVLTLILTGSVASAVANAAPIEMACALITDQDASALVGTPLQHREYWSVVKPGVVRDSYCDFNNPKYEMGAEVRLELMDDAGGASQAFDAMHPAKQMRFVSEDVAALGDRARLLTFSGGDMLLVVLKEKSLLTLFERTINHMPSSRRPAMIEAMKQMLSVLAAAPPEALVHPTNAACDLLSRHDADAVFGPTPVQPGRPRGAALEIHAQPSISTTCAFYFYSYPKGSKVAPTPEETGMELFADATVAFEDFNTLAKDANYSYEPVKGVGDSAVFRTDRTGGLTLVALSGSEVLTITLVRSGQIPNPAHREPEMIEAMKLMLSGAALAVPTASDEAAPGLHRRAAQQP